MEQARALAPAITLLVAGILAIALARPLRVSPIVGYLAAGMAIGPHGLSLVPDSETTRLLAELGVVFLLFDIGLHFSLRHIWAARRDILGLAPLQVALCGAGFAFLAARAGIDLTVALIVGATLALSSTAAVAQTLKERGHQDCPVGVSSMAVLIFQDVCAIFLLILAHALAGAGAAIGAAAVKALVAFGVAVALGLSLTLGAFLGGMIIAETPYRHVVQAEVMPFRGLLLGFFFITMGMTLDPALLARDWTWILAAVALLLSIKTALGLMAALVLRMPAAGAVQFAFLLAQGSEFAFVILGFPAVRTALGPDYSAVLITAVAASLALTPFIASVGQRLAKALAGRGIAAGQAAASPTA